MISNENKWQGFDKFKSIYNILIANHVFEIRKEVDFPHGTAYNISEQ